jgi:hypothetical protein
MARSDTDIPAIIATMFAACVRQQKIPEVTSPIRLKGRAIAAVKAKINVGFIWFCALIETLLIPEFVDAFGKFVGPLL